MRKPKVIIITTHLRRDRSKRRTVDILQPIKGLHIGSLIDQNRYEVTLYNEDLHGPYDTDETRLQTYCILREAQPFRFHISIAE